MTAVWKYVAMSIAPAAWIITTQLGQILPYSDCLKQNSSSLAAVATGLLIALTGIAVSYRGQGGAGDRTRVFVDHLSIGIGVAFTFALVLQVAATLLVDACQR